MVILNTERLVLRHLEPDDIDSLYTLYRDPEIRQYYPDGTRTFEQTKEELNWFRHGHPHHPELGLWATIDRSTGEFLGRCGLLPWDIEGKYEVELAYMIKKTRWREGLAIPKLRKQSSGMRATRWAFVSTDLPSIAPETQRVSLSMKGLVCHLSAEWSDEFGLCHIYSRALHPLREASNPQYMDSIPKQENDTLCRRYNES
ncbi:MAG: GNAT family N-acetyltransferase [Betaproteobacteria bacterium]|nr:GNAT family N-acetyltransferase [Betaproteobacteria bacterium]